MFDLIENNFKIREPILKKELAEMLPINNENTVNQLLSNMVKFGLLDRFLNGVYYIPHPDERFKDVQPLLIDYLNKKYLSHFRGLRVGAFLLYKYKFTTQVSSYYELISNEVSKNTRSKIMFEGKVSVSYPKFELNESTYDYHEFLEIIHYIRYSDHGFDKNLEMLQKLLINKNLNPELLNEYFKNYKSNRLFYMKEYIDKLNKYETT